MQQSYIYQIFYDDLSKQMLDPGFIPLDNTSSEHPDWYEFWPILRFLRETPLNDGVWYGFLSPKFAMKTRMDSRMVSEFLQSYSHVDVAIFNAGWGQIAYFLNPFEQGECWHPGLLDLSQEFVDYAGLNVDLHSLVTTSVTTVYANFIVAKAAYWRKWMGIANSFFSFCEDCRNPKATRMLSDGNYTKNSSNLQMKVFIQERLPALILSQTSLRVAGADISNHANIPLEQELFVDNLMTRRLLQACDLLKQYYCLTKEKDYLSVYHKLRNQVPVTEFLQRFNLQSTTAVSRGANS